MTPCPTCGALPCDQVSQATEQVSDDAVVERVARAVSEAGGAANWDHALEVARAAPAAIPATHGDDVGLDLLILIALGAMRDDMPPRDVAAVQRFAAALKSQQGEQK